jgi:ssDNA-binding Zn-finger/Zn-ribbon topoisomerase 1
MIITPNLQELFLSRLDLSKLDIDESFHEGLIDMISTASTPGDSTSFDDFELLLSECLDGLFEEEKIDSIVNYCKTIFSEANKEIEQKNQVNIIGASSGSNIGVVKANIDKNALQNLIKPAPRVPTIKPNTNIVPSVDDGKQNMTRQYQIPPPPPQQQQQQPRKLQIVKAGETQGQGDMQMQNSMRERDRNYNAGQNGNGNGNWNDNNHNNNQNPKNNRQKNAQQNQQNFPPQMNPNDLALSALVNQIGSEQLLRVLTAAQMNLNTQNLMNGIPPPPHINSTEIPPPPPTLPPPPPPPLLSQTPIQSQKHNPEPPLVIKPDFNGETYNLFVTQIPVEISSKHLADFFADFGELVQIRFVGSSPLKAAVIQYANESSCLSVLQKKVPVCGNTSIQVEWARVNVTFFGTKNNDNKNSDKSGSYFHDIQQQYNYQQYQDQYQQQQIKKVQPMGIELLKSKQLSLQNVTKTISSMKKMKLNTMTEQLENKKELQRLEKNEDILQDEKLNLVSKIKPKLVELETKLKAINTQLTRLTSEYNELSSAIAKDNEIRKQIGEKKGENKQEE